MSRTKEEKTMTSPENPEKKQQHRKRRGHGEGSVFKRKGARAGKKNWVAQITLKNGKNKQFYFETEKEAQRGLRQALHDLEQGKLITERDQTMKQFLEYWLEGHRKFVRVNTYRIYRQYLDRHVIPVLGHVRLQKLSPRHIQELYGRDLNKGYAPETIRGVHRMLHKALSDAVQWNWVAANACDKVKQPGPVRYETHPLTPEQAKTLMETAKGSRLEALLTLAVTTGMRRGEILALRWSDIDFEERSLQVRHTVNRAGKYGILENAPKTEKSKRRIMLPQFVLDALKKHRAQQDEIRLQAGPTWQEHNLVFTTDTGGFVEGTHLNRRFKQLLKEAGLPDMRFHDLRHSAATILLGKGVHPKLVQELLGHSQMSITMDRYSHVLPSMQRDMMKGLDDLYKEI